MRLMNRITALILSASVLAGNAGAVGSRGFGNQAIGAYPLGQGNAVAARTEDISMNFFNPAGLGFLEKRQISLGGEILTPSYSHKSTSGVNEDAKDNAFAVPSVFAGGRFGSSAFAWGLGVTSPFGLATEWSNTGFSKYVATKSELKVLHVNPNLAWRVSDSFSVGAGIDYMQSKADLNRQVSVAAVNYSLPPNIYDPTTPDGSFRLNGDGHGWGYNAAVILKPSEKQSLGLTYRGPVSMTVEGNAELSNLSGSMAFVFGGSNYSTGGESVIRYPDATTLGYSVRFTPKLTAEIDLEWTGWSTFYDQRINYTEETDPTRLAILNDGNPQARRWKDVPSAALGAQYQLNPSVALRTGYLFMKSPVPDATFEPSVPDSDLHGLALGVGFQRGPVRVDAAYLANFFRSRTIQNSVGAPLSNVSGQYSSFANSFALNVAFSF